MDILSDTQVLGYILAIILTISSCTDYICMKDTLNKIGFRSVLYRGLFSMPLLFIAMALNFKLDTQCIPYLIVYCVLETLNVVFTNKGLQKIPLTINGSLSNLTIIVSAILAMAFKAEPVTKAQLGATFIYTFGLFLVLELFSSKNTRDIRLTSDVIRGMVLVLLAVFSKCFKLIILQFLLGKDLISNETLLFFGLFTANAMIWLNRKEDINLKEDFKDKRLVKLIAIQICCIVVGTLTKGRAINLIGNVPVNIIGAFSLVVQTYLVHKTSRESVSKSTAIGTIIILLSSILFIMGK